MSTKLWNVDQILEFPPQFGISTQIWNFNQILEFKKIWFFTKIKLISAQISKSFEKLFHFLNVASNFRKGGSRECVILVWSGSGDAAETFCSQR